MRYAPWMAATLLSTGIAVSLPVLTPALAHDESEHQHAGHHDHGGTGHSHAKSRVHGGQVSMAGTYHFEAVYGKNGLWLFLYDMDQKPLALKGATGSVVLKGQGNPRTTTYNLRYGPAGPQSPQDYLYAPIDFSRTADRSLTVTYRLAKLPDRDDPQEEFSQPFVLTRSRGGLTVTKATAADRPAIEAQKTCPVSGEDLESMGGPLKVTLADGRSTFICCKGCIKKIQENPDKYLGKAPQAAHHQHTE